MTIRFGTDFSIRLIGYEPPWVIRDQSGGSSDAPLLAHVLIHLDKMIFMIAPSRCQDIKRYQGYRKRSIKVEPSQWERQGSEYVIHGKAFLKKLYSHMGWRRDISYTVPEFEAPANTVFPNIDDENGVEGPFDIKPLCFNLAAATPSELVNTMGFLSPFSRLAFSLEV